MKNYISVFLVLFACQIFSKNKLLTVYYVDSAQSIVFTESIDLINKNVSEKINKRPNPILQLFRKKQKLNKKITSAVLAFPFPFGIVGLHRIYLGTKPYVPVTYIATLGGVFGILPFIDFCVITFNKDFDQYRDNGKVFMWVKD